MTFWEIGSSTWIAALLVGELTARVQHGLRAMEYLVLALPRTCVRRQWVLMPLLLLIVLATMTASLTLLVSVTGGENVVFWLVPLIGILGYFLSAPHWAAEFAIVEPVTSALESVFWPQAATERQFQDGLLTTLSEALGVVVHPEKAITTNSRVDLSFEFEGRRYFLSLKRFDGTNINQKRLVLQGELEDICQHAEVEHVKDYHVLFVVGVSGTTSRIQHHLEKLENSVARKLGIHATVIAIPFCHSPPPVLDTGL